MHSKRIKKSSVPKRKRRAMRRVKARKGTLPFLLALCVLMVLLILFAPGLDLTPAANVSGTDIDQEAASTGNTNLRISEVMSSNRSAFPDEVGSFPDWIELTNAGDTPIPLKGYGLSDRADKITFVFPDITLNPGEYVIVFASDENKNIAGQPLHAKFKLSSSGDTLFLFGSDGIAFSEVAIPAMDRNMSYCAIGNNEYIITSQYTPDYPNTQEGFAAFRASTVLTTGSLIINEICASSITTLKDEDGEYPDWIELYNASDKTIDLSNYALSDDPDSLVKWRFPQGAVIKPGEYYVVYASGKDRPAVQGGWPHASFKLRSNGETVILADIQGRMLDLVTYDLLESDTSWGRDEEGLSGFKRFTQPTPGHPNTRLGEVAMDTAFCLANTSGLYITEVMSGNKSVVGPGVKNPYDYIEIYNMSGQAVNLKGYGLSDNIKKPRKWQLPDITIENNSYQVIYCDTTQTTKDGVYYFTNYNLAKSGETVCLSTPSGEILDKVVIPQLYDDVSFGRTLGQAGLFYYASPTPGESNGRGFIGFAETPVINTPGGLYERQLLGSNAVTLSVPANSVVRYTLDGTDPDERSPQYTQPIEIEKNTVLRARSFRDGVEPSQVVSQTYLISVYHTMPVVCLTTDPDNMWNEETGMFADGPELDREAQERPWDNATYWQKNWFGGWVEYYDEEGRQQISQGMTFRVMGQFSLDMPQKSLYVKADGQYGKSSFDYAFFEERPYETYAGFVLRNGGQDGLFSRVIDGMQARLVDQSGSTLANQAWKPVIVYINGQYWGHYNLRERAGAKMIAQHEGWENPDDIDLLEGDGIRSSNINQGSNKAYKDLVEYVESHDLVKDQKAYEYVCSQIDIDNMLDYFIFESFFGNTDPGNIRFYRNAKSGDGKWRYLLYDVDWGFFSVTGNRGKLIGGVEYVLNPKGMGDHRIKSNVLVRNLIKVPEIQDRFLTRYGQYFQTVLTTEYMTNLFNEMILEIKPEMQMHMQRWAAEVHPKVSFDQPKNPEGGYNYWVSRCERMLERIFPRRPYYIWQEIIKYFGLTEAQMVGYFGPCPPKPAD
ncbi:MAG: lamin tail domain-containing protein [Clostridia bacterium]|nr:lamin tail domain-containing protein [Clostridia bacterium]